VLYSDDHPGNVFAHDKYYYEFICELRYV
jgi:hypothetical protein